MDDLTVIPDKDLKTLRAQLVEQLGGVSDFTPGTFQDEWGRCGKPSCHCHLAGDPGHGPRYSVVRYVAGKTVKRTVPARLVDVVRESVDRWRVFKSITDQIGDINAEMSRRLLVGEHVTRHGSSPVGGEKGGSSARPV